MSFLQTDAGRSESKRPRQRADCTVRSLATIFRIPYDEAYAILASAGRKCNAGFDIEAWARKTAAPDWYFRLQKMPYTKDAAARRYRLMDFLKDRPKGRFIVSTAKHVFAVVDGVVHDDLPWHYHENRPVYSWIELLPVRLPLWQAFAVRSQKKHLTKRKVRFKRCVAIVEGISYKMAMRTASKQYEWAVRNDEDLTVQPFNSVVPMNSVPLLADDELVQTGHNFNASFLWAMRVCRRCGHTEDMVREGERLFWKPR